MADWYRNGNKMALLGSYFLCATVLSRFTLDRSLSIRHAIWAVITLYLFLSLRSIPRNRIMYFFAGYFIFAAASLFWACNFYEGLHEVTKIFLLTASFCVVCENKDYLIKGLTVLGLIIGGYSLVEILFSGYSGGCLGTMGVRNLWSSAQLLLLPVCAYSAVNSRNNSEMVLGILSSVILVISILLLSNRASILALCVMAAALLIWYKKYRYIIAVGLIVSTAFILNPGLFNTDSMKARYAVWSASAQLIRENPFYGKGINNWQLEVPRYATMFLEEDAFERNFYFRPHNDPIWVLSETGVFGFICYMGIFVCGLYYSIKTKNVLALTGIAGYLVIAMLSFPKERAFHSMMLLFYLALSIKGCKKIRLSLPARVPATIALCGVAIIMMLWYSSEIHVRKMAVARDTKQWREVLSEAEKISPIHTLDLVTIPVRWYTSEAHYYLGDKKQAVIDAVQAIKYSPNNIYVLDRMGSVFAGLGNNRMAKACFERALSIRPGFTNSLDKLNKLKGIDYVND